MTERVDPKTLTIELGGKWMRSYGSAPCPCCQPERRRDQNALTISERDGRLLLHCKKSGCDFTDLLSGCGIQQGGFDIDLAAAQRAQRERREAEAKAQQRARNLWQQGKPIPGTQAETYLRGRGITCDLPNSLRWVADHYHQPTGRFCSVMVANVVCLNVSTSESSHMGVHRTFFTKQGERLAQSAKMMLGPCRGGAVRVSDGDGPLVVAEGIETALSLASGLLSGPARVWAALSTSGVAGLALPPVPQRLTIAPDGDDAGKKAANALANRADALGWKVSLLPAPDGRDWNDVLMGRVAK